MKVISNTVERKENNKDPTDDSNFRNGFGMYRIKQVICFYSKNIIYLFIFIYMERVAGIKLFFLY